MDQNIETLQYAQRLRYEAFSRFATSLNKCNTYTEVAAVLESQLKFIINTFILRVYYQNATSSISFQGFIGQNVFFNQNDVIYFFEKDALNSGIPAAYSADQVFTNTWFANTIFTHQNVFSLVTIPAIYSADNQIVISIATTQNKQLVKPDYKFIQLISDFLANKLASMLMLEGIAKSNKELEVKNKQIYSLNQYLDITVKERTEELTNTNAELKTLLYRTTHDFRAPLANILGLVNLAKTTTDDEDVLLLFEHSRSVVEGMDKMLSKLNATIITDDESNKLQLIDFEVIINSLRQKFKDQLDTCQCKIVFNSAHTQPYHSYINIVTAIFDSLIDNSLNFQDKINKLIITINISVQDHYLNITFSDNGQGIDASIIPKVFEMYYRGSAASTGHGLGLYIVHKLVKYLKGNITVQSKLNQYTTFTLQLPL